MNIDVRSHGAWTALVSEKRHVIINDVLKNLDYSNQDAVRAAHKKIRHMGPVDSFLDCYFSPGNKDKSLRGVATLALLKDAEAKGQTTVYVPGDRNEALTALAERLQPVGEEVLKYCLEPHAKKL